MVANKKVSVETEKKTNPPRIINILKSQKKYRIKKV